MLPKITSKGPKAPARIPAVTIIFLTSGSSFAKPSKKDLNWFPKSITIGKSIPPISSIKSPNWFCSCFKPPAPALAAASAAPPYCLSNSSSIKVWASASLFVSASSLITFFCSSENWIPLRLRADKFAIGSFNALPNWILADFKSPSNLVAKFNAASCVLSNCSPAILVNVKSWEVASFKITSSPNKVFPCSSEAIFWSCLEVNPAAIPVDLIPASTCAIAFCCLSKAAILAAPKANNGKVKFLESVCPVLFIEDPNFLIDLVDLFKLLWNCLSLSDNFTLRFFCAIVFI